MMPTQLEAAHAISGSSHQPAQDTRHASPSTEGDTLAEQLTSEILTCEAAYHRVVLAMTAAERRRDIDGCDQAEQERAAVAQVYRLRLHELSKVTGLSRNGLVLQAEILSLLFDRFQHEVCDEFRAAAMAFAANVTVVLSEETPDQTLPACIGNSTVDFRTLAQGALKGLEQRPVRVADFMAAAAMADATTLDAVDAEFVAFEASLTTRLRQLLDTKPRSTTDIVILAKVVIRLLQHGDEAAATRLFLPLGLMLCGAVCATSRRLGRI